MPSSMFAIAALAALPVACGASPSAPCVYRDDAFAARPATPPPPASASATTPASPAPVASVASASPKPSPPPPALKDALDAADNAIGAGDMKLADQKIAAAEAAAGDDAHLAHLVARARATRWVYAGDFDRAAAAFVAVLPALAKHPELPDEFWAHNTMMMILEAAGDPAAALAENDQATLAAARGTWDPEGRDKLALQKDRWHRAYLTRMLAESRAGSAKQALVQYAQAALDEYRAIGFPESIAILDAYFAALDGKRDAALAAAKKIDPATNDDVEDLYLVVIGLEAGGDHAGAEAVRRVMRRPSHPHIAHAIMLRWLDLDAKPAKPHPFTPRFAAAR